MQSHQNRFHASILRVLTDKFAATHDNDMVGTDEKKLWEYFAGLYKHANQGIKGRGKDRKVGLMQ